MNPSPLRLHFSRKLAVTIDLRLVSVLGSGRVRQVIGRGATVRRDELPRSVGGVVEARAPLQSKDRRYAWHVQLLRSVGICFVVRRQQTV